MTTKLILHVGMSKTATTTIQHFLDLNRDWLLERGVLYPGMQTSINHRHWGERLAKPVGSDAFQGADGYFKECVGKQSAQHPSATVLVSYEGLFELTSHTRAGQRAQKLVDSLQGFEVHPLAYLRRQDRWLESMYNQRVKTGGEHRTLDEYIVRMRNRNRGDLYARSQFFRERFGAENLTLRLFERGEFIDGDILCDFCAQLGIDSLEGAQRPPDSNPGLNASLLAVKRRINPALKSLWMRRAGKHVAMAAQRLTSGKGKRVMPYATALELMEAYAPGNERVAREFLGREDGRLFSRLPADEAPWEHY